MATKYLCPHCSRETYYLDKETVLNNTVKRTRKQIIYPWKDSNGNMIWKNVFHLDWVSIGIIIGIICLLIGMRQVNQQCYDVLQDPCKISDKMGCCDYTIQNTDESIGQKLQIVPIENP